jgi:hypothetical protein
VFVENNLMSGNRSSLAMTECIQQSFDFHDIGAREIRARFDGGAIASDAGALLLREVELRTGIIQQFAACIKDHRDPCDGAKGLGLDG